MPQAVLSASALSARLGQPVHRDSVEPALFRSKAEVARWEGDELTIEVTPDRIDLLTESGLALHLAGALGLAHGLPTVLRASDVQPAPAIEVDPSTVSLRPAVAGVLLEAPPDSPLDADLLSEAIRYQELLHATRGADRRVASLGIYPWERLTPPIRYASEPVAALEFVPLGQDSAVSGRQFFEQHPLAQQYGRFGRAGDACLTLRDANGTILSLPPILNSRSGGEARVGDRVLLLESTGIRASAVEDMVGLLLMVFAARGWKAAPVAVRSGEAERSGREVIDPRSLSLTSGRLQELSGHPWNAVEVEQRISEVRLGGHPAPHGWRVDIPPWRPDLQTETDLVEDLVLARGVRPEDALVAPSQRAGRRMKESRFSLRVSTLLLGLGYTELHNPVLTGRPVVDRLGREGAVALANSPSEQYSVFRNTLLLSLIGTLERNVRFGYPQHFFEVGAVIVADAGSETGTRTRQHAAACYVGERAGFADGAALIDYVMTALGAAGIREPAELSGTIPGRAAVVRLAGERVAEIGELHPRLLTAARVPVPAVWAELDLSALWPILRRGEAD